MQCIHLNVFGCNFDVQKSYMGNKANITQLLLTVNRGDPDAYNKLFEIVYDELRRIANEQLNYEYSDHTLSKTELVHEAYIKLVDQAKIDFNDRTHFYAIAARSMRQLLVDYARKKKAEKRGGGAKPLPLDENILHIKKHAKNIIELDEHLDQLSELDERLGQIVELRFFAGLSIKETAKMLDLSASTVNRDWAKARGWLYQRLKAQHG